LIVNLLMFVDGVLLKRIVAEAAMAKGATVDAAATVANEQEGYYGAVQTIARLPYQLILAVTFVIFPLVSRATFEKDAEKTRGYVRATMRYSLVVVAMMAATLAARPTAVMRLFYKPEYAVGGPALGILLVGYVSFSLFNIAGTIINGSGKTKPTMIIGAVTLVLNTVMNWLAIEWALKGHHDPLLAAAAATTVAMTFGLLASGLYLMRDFGAFLQPMSLVRTGLAVIAVLAVGRVWPSTGFLGGKVGTLVACAVSAVVFLVVAVGSGELRPKEILRSRRA
jgi:stage V sporulation protein B